jgi:hypothetical protein
MSGLKEVNGKNSHEKVAKLLIYFLSLDVS